MISLGKNINEHKEEQQNELFGETHQRAGLADVFPQ
jgi:hypothetical protein